MQQWQILENTAYQNILDEIFYDKDMDEKCLLTYWELWKVKMPPSNKVQMELDVWTDLWHPLLETQTELVELMQKEEISTSPDMLKDGWKHSSPWLPEVVDFPRCNNADSDLYMRMPTDPSLTDQKLKCCLGFARKKISFRIQPSPQQILGFHIEILVTVYAGTRETLCLFTNKLLQYYHPRIRLPPEKPFYVALMQSP